MHFEAPGCGPEQAHFVKDDVAMKLLASALALLAPFAAIAAEPLPSWNDGATRAAIIDFVAEVVDPTSDGYVPEAERIAVFDNDGTLWAENPYYFQFISSMDRAAELARANPGWANTPALAAAAAGDLEAVLKLGWAAQDEIVAATHSDMPVDDYLATVETWFEKARHPTTGRRYDRMIYQPMVELLDHLRDNGFSTWIVSGSDTGFLRAFAERAYGVPPQNVVGSQTNMAFEVVGGVPEVLNKGGRSFFTDKGGKAVAISRHVGRRPVFVAGNSDGDLEMAQWSTADDGPVFVMLVHHTDAAREWAYDRKSRVGRLDRALDAAAADGWTVVDMARDWSRIWPD